MSLLGVQISQAIHEAHSAAERALAELAKRECRVCKASGISARRAGIGPETALDLWPCACTGRSGWGAREELAPIAEQLPDAEYYEQLRRGDAATPSP